MQKRLYFQGDFFLLCISYCCVFLLSFMIYASTLRFPNFWGIIPHMFPSFPTFV